MFPIPWNFPFRKKNGDMSTIGAEIGGAGSELPPHGVGDAGKLLGVKANGKLEWSDTVNSEIQTLTNEVDTIVNDLTAKNFLNIDLTELKTLNTSGTWADNVYSANGLTFTVNGNKTITVSGTATASTNLSLKNDISISGDYILSGCPTGGSQIDDEGYNIQARVDGSWISAKDSGDGLPITVNSIIDKTLIHVANGTVMNNHVFKPMIRPASIEDGTYVPYAMTNRELTKRQIAYVDISFSGVTPTAQDNIYFYAVQLPLEIRNTAEIIGAVFKSGTMFGLSLKYNVTTQQVYLESATNGAISTTVRVFYYVP